MPNPLLDALLAERAADQRQQAEEAPDELRLDRPQKRERSDECSRPARLLQDLAKSAGPRPAEPFVTEPAVGGWNGYLALEVFAGSKTLTMALREAGFTTIAIDIKEGGAAHDLSRPGTLAALKQCGPHYVHLAPCCNRYSSAR